MSSADKIREILTRRFSPVKLEVLDESAAHAGHGAQGGHFAVWIVSADFSGLKSIDRHRKIHEILDSEMKNEIHALRIRALTPEESINS